MRRVLPFVLVLAAGSASAQIAPQVDCAADTLDVAEVRYCASEAFETADAELNEVYRLALTRAKVFDEEAHATGVDLPMDLEEALRQAQRDWLAFRDSDCDAFALTYRGGTGAPTAGTVCRTERTLTRTEELRALAADF